MTAPIPHFVSFEVGNFVDAISRLGFLATGRSRTGIAVLRMEAVVDISTEAFRAMKPRARANEGAAGKPLRAVVTVGSAFVGCGVIVSVGTFRRGSDFDTDLSLCFGRRYRQADSSNCRKCKQLKSVHSIISILLDLDIVGQ